jgi:hypothetical protein
VTRSFFSSSSSSSQKINFLFILVGFYSLALSSPILLFDGLLCTFYFFLLSSFFTLSYTRRRSASSSLAASDRADMILTIPPPHFCRAPSTDFSHHLSHLPSLFPFFGQWGGGGTTTRRKKKKKNPKNDRYNKERERGVITD